MADVALEIPLRALALARRRQRHGAADARVQPLGDALDDAALAGRVAALEQHDELELLVDHPVLQLDQLALQPQQLGEVAPAIDALGRRHVGHAVRQARQEVVAQLQLELLVEIVLKLVANPILEAWLIVG